MGSFNQSSPMNKNEFKREKSDIGVAGTRLNLTVINTAEGRLDH